jgi:hypothetical protein
MATSALSETDLVASSPPVAGASTSHLSSIFIYFVNHKFL